MTNKALRSAKYSDYKVDKKKFRDLKDILLKHYEVYAVQHSRVYIDVPSEHFESIVIIFKNSINARNRFKVKYCNRGDVSNYSYDNIANVIKKIDSILKNVEKCWGVLEWVKH